MSEDQAKENTDRELYQEPAETESMSYYSPSIHVTKEGLIGMKVGGYVIVRSIQDWHKLAHQQVKEQMNAKAHDIDPDMRAFVNENFEQLIWKDEPMSEFEKALDFVFAELGHTSKSLFELSLRTRLLNAHQQEMRTKLRHLDKELDHIARAYNRLPDLSVLAAVRIVIDAERAKLKGGTDDQ